MAKLKSGAKRCPAHEGACQYLGCAKVAGICLIQRSDDKPPFKRMSKLEPSPSKRSPKGRKK